LYEVEEGFRLVVVAWHVEGRKKTEFTFLLTTMRPAAEGLSEALRGITKRLRSSAVQTNAFAMESVDVEVPKILDKGWPAQ
jgi:hypothetical protein